MPGDTQFRTGPVTSPLLSSGCAGDSHSPGKVMGGGGIPGLRAESWPFHGHGSQHLGTDPSALQLPPPQVPVLEERRVPARTPAKPSEGLGVPPRKVAFPALLGPGGREQAVEGGPPDLACLALGPGPPPVPWASPGWQPSPGEAASHHGVGHHDGRWPQTPLEAVATRHAGGPLGQRSQEPSQPLLPYSPGRSHPARLWGWRPALPPGSQARWGQGDWAGPTRPHCPPVQGAHGPPLASAQICWHLRLGSAHPLQEVDLAQTPPARIPSARGWRGKDPARCGVLASQSVTVSKLLSPSEAPSPQWAARGSVPLCVGRAMGVRSAPSPIRAGPRPPTAGGEASVAGP